MLKNRRLGGNIFSAMTIDRVQMLGRRPVPHLVQDRDWLGVETRDQIQRIGSCQGLEKPIRRVVSVFVPKMKRFCEAFDLLDMLLMMTMIVTTTTTTMAMTKMLMKMTMMMMMTKMLMTMTKMLMKITIMMVIVTLLYLLIDDDITLISY